MEPRSLGVLAPLPRNILWDIVAPGVKDKGRVPKLDFIVLLWLEDKG